GGRRNRRGREGESFAPEAVGEPELIEAGSADEPTGEAVAPAVADPELEPRAASHPETPSDEPPRTEITPQEAQSAPIPHLPGPEAAAPEPPPRRRSTVREPAAQGWGDDKSPPAPSFTPPFTPPVPSSIEPVVSSSAEGETDRPRRSGWWSKRVLGKG